MEENYRKIIPVEPELWENEGIEQRTGSITELPTGSDKLYRAAFENSNDAVSIVINDTYIYVNNRFLSMFGHDSKNAIIGKTTWSFTVHPDDAEMVKTYAARRLRGEQAPSNYEFRALKKDGSDIYIEISVSDIIYQDQKAILACFRDVTDRRYAEELLKKAERKYRDIFENAVEGIFQIRVFGAFLSVNQAFSRMLGFESPDEMIRLIQDFKPYFVESGDAEQFKDTLEQNGVAQGFEAQFYRKDGSTIWVLVNARAVYNDQGSIMYYEGTVEDITERKHLEDIHEQQLHLAQSLIDTVPSPVYYKDINGRYMGCNKAFEGYHGITMDSLLGKSVYDILPLDLADYHASKDRFLFQNPGSQTYESHLNTPDGKKRSISVKKATFFNRDGEVGGLVGVLLDITEHKEAETVMRAERNKFRTLSDNAPIGIVLINPGGDFEYINPKFQEIFGYTLDDVPNGREWFRKAYPDPEYRQKVISTWKEDLERFAIGERKSWMFKVRCKDGTTKTINFIPVGLETDEHIMTCEDVTEAIRTQEVIESSEQTLKAILTASPVGIGLIYRSAMSWVNDATYAMTGYGPFELDGQDIDILYADPDERRRVREELLLRNESETQWVRKDGSIIDVLVRMAPLKNHQDSMIATAEEITVRKRAIRALEQSRLELERLDRAKTKAIHHISHELKTPLAIIQGNLKLVNRKLQRIGESASSLSSNIETIEKHVLRLAGMQQESEKIFAVVKEMEKTTFAADCERLWERVEAVSQVPETIRAHWQIIHGWINNLQMESKGLQRNNLFDAARDTIGKTRHLASSRDIKMEIYGDADTEVSINPVVLRDILTDLLKNAVEHTPDDGLITVLVEKEGGLVWLSVTDHGVGITGENQKFIFDGLFHIVDTESYTSKKPYSFGAGGKGLGLLKIKIYSQRYGFGLSMRSQRCKYLSRSDYECPGKISLCTHSSDPRECIDSGGTTVTLSFDPFAEPVSD